MTLTNVNCPPCPMPDCTEAPAVLTVDSEALRRYVADRMPVQVAFSTLSAEDRELIITGTHPACWDRVFGEDD